MVGPKPSPLRVGQTTPSADGASTIKSTILSTSETCHKVSRIPLRMRMMQANAWGHTILRHNTVPCATPNYMPYPPMSGKEPRLPTWRRAGSANKTTVPTAVPARCEPDSSPLQALLTHRQATSRCRRSTPAVTLLSHVGAQSTLVSNVAEAQMRDNSSQEAKMTART